MVSGSPQAGGVPKETHHKKDDKNSKKNSFGRSRKLNACGSLVLLPYKLFYKNVPQIILYYIRNS